MKIVQYILVVIMTVAIVNNANAITSNQQEANKRVVMSFYDAAINQKDFASASRYLGRKYIQHNPTAADGAEGLKAFIQFLREKFPNAHSDVKRIFAQDDYVILHVHSVREPDTRGRAIFDLFRLDNGKIVEHWDAVQEIPDGSANDNGMF